MEDHLSDELSYEQLYSDLVDAATQSEPPARSFSATQFAKDTGMTRPRALERLQVLRTAGQISGDKFVIDGSRQWRFWFKGEA